MTAKQLKSELIRALMTRDKRTKKARLRRALKHFRERYPVRICGCGKELPENTVRCSCEPDLTAARSVREWAKLGFVPKKPSHPDLGLEPWQVYRSPLLVAIQNTASLFLRQLEYARVGGDAFTDGFAVREYLLVKDSDLYRRYLYALQKGSLESAHQYAMVKGELEEFWKTRGPHAISSTSRKNPELKDDGVRWGFPEYIPTGAPAGRPRKKGAAGRPKKSAQGYRMRCRAQGCDTEFWAKRKTAEFCSKHKRRPTSRD